jgi:hypothetical protein
MRLTQTGNVGIGTTSPTERLEVSADTNSRIKNQEIGGNSSTWLQQAVSSYLIADNDWRFYTNGSERSRIDSSGNLLVGKTSNSVDIVGGIIRANGLVNGCSDSNYSAIFSRNTNDGDIVLFRKDGATVGGIGTYLGDSYIGTGVAGLRFYDAGPAVSPHNTTTNAGTDGTIDLGVSAGRFKDLYLSGGAYLGGTVAANKLDDYEEGTWTPVTNNGSWTVNSATYTKIGNVVTCRFHVTATTAIGSNDLTGLPFTPATYSSGVCGYQNSETGVTYGILVTSTNIWNFRLGSTQKGLANGAQVMGMFSYHTTA